MDYTKNLLFPGLGNSFITYGQAYYSSLANAKTGITTEPVVLDPYLSLEGSLRGYLIVKRGTSALNDAVNNIFVSTGKLGEAMAGGAAGGDVIGPASSIENSLARFDGTSGKIIKDGANIVADDSGNIGIGTVSPQSLIHAVTSTTNTSNVGITFEVYTDGAAVANGSGVICKKARGTEVSPSNVASNDSIAYISARGYGTTGFSSAGRASMIMKSAEDWTDSSQGTYISFETTQNGSTTRSEKLRIGNNGVITAGIVDGRVNVASISTSSYTARSDDRILLCNAYSNPVTIDLASAANLTGKIYTFKKIDSNLSSNVVIDPYLSETIDGSSTYVISNTYGHITMVSDGSNWLEIS